MKYLFIYLLIINIAGLMVMGIDKRKARARAWRISEKTLFLFSALGGSFGTLIGMYLFRHKTKQWSFVFGMPLILVFHIVILCLLIDKVYG